MVSWTTSSFLTVFAGFLAGMSRVALGAQGTAFRGKDLTAYTSSMKVEALRAALLDELMGSLGHSNKVTEGRLGAIEETLRPMYRALHKNMYGNLDHAGVRYALHRLFVQRHGMFIKGLEPGGAGWSGASPTEVMDDRVPAFVQSLFEDRLNGRGLGLHEVAILAATLEHLVHDEVTDQLRIAYNASRKSIEGQHRMDEVEEIIDMYMSIFLMGVNSTSADLQYIRDQREQIEKLYPSWPESQRFTREVQNEVTAGSLGLTFNGTAHLLETIMDRYGKWQDKECQAIKTSLTALEAGVHGRVPLKNFYGSAKDGMWQFTESVAYLKDLGALDESDPHQTTVIIPNYVNSHSNCLASSSIYSVCCLNECEPLLLHLEKEVGEPDAQVEKVFEIISKLPSSTTTVPREISKDMRERLLDIAKHHDGRVPLHGRLFGQWLHHMYPRECPYPHKSGTTNPLTPDEWISENGKNNIISKDEMDEFTNSLELPPSPPPQVLEGDKLVPAPSPLLWTSEEELVVVTTARPSSSMRLRSGILTALVAVAALLSLASAVWSTGKGTLQALCGNKGHVLPFAGKVHAC